MWSLSNTIFTLREEERDERNVRVRKRQTRRWEEKEWEIEKQ